MMKRQIVDIMTRNWKKWLWWLIAAFILYIFLLGPTGFYRIYRLYRLNRELQAKIIAATEANEQLKKEQEALKNDPARIEREAREQYGMARPDEVIIKVRQP